MDFLDPKRKKSHRRRLLVGYLLTAVALSMATWLLLNSSFGYWVDPKTGSIIQNGTVYMNSSPSGAFVTLNGQVQSNKTASRLVLPGSKQYSVKLSLDSYRDWIRTFALEGGKIERLTYPLLVPKNLTTTESQLYASQPGLSGQSIDKRWLLVQQPGQTYVFDLYDLNNSAATPVSVTIPANILTDSTKAATLSIVDWSSDNRHVLMERNGDGIHEFLMIDTANIASSVNINTVLTVSPTSVNLRDKKADQLYIYDSSGGIVRIGDLKNRTVSGAILNNVLAYKSFGSDIILYAVPSTKDPAKTDFRIRENDKSSYLLKTLTAAEHYLADVSEFDGTPYYVVGTELDNAAFLYRDPLATLKGQSQSPLLVASVLRLDKIKFVSFSLTSQFVAAQSGNKLVVYDIEGDRQYKLDLAHDIAVTTKLTWMDGFRLAFNDKTTTYMTDFDGSNEQALVPGVSGPYFAGDFKDVFSVAPSKTVNGRFALTQTSLIKK